MDLQAGDSFSLGGYCSQSDPLDDDSPFCLVVELLDVLSTDEWVGLVFVFVLCNVSVTSPRGTFALS